MKYGKILKDMSGYYQISNFGRIKSLERKSNCCYGKQRILKEKIIYPSFDGKGYPRIMLCKDNKKQRFHVHRLVAENFIENYKKDMIIHHIDYDKENNYFNNLYVCTRKEHTTLHNKTDRLIKELIKNNLIKFEEGKYILTKEQYENNCYKVVE